MPITEFIATEFASYVVGKQIESIEDRVKRKRREKELLARFDTFCKDSRWRDLFEAQGLRDSLDFTGLTEALKQSIVDNTYNYYRSLNLDRVGTDFDPLLTELYEIARADTRAQQKQVQAIVYAAYHMAFVFYVESLSGESKLALNIGMWYTDQKIAQLKAQIENLLKQNQSKIALLDSYIPPTQQFVGRKEALDEIARRFQSGESAVVISGLGGMGKSELAKRYAQENRDDYEIICFAYYSDSMMNTINNLSWNYGPWNEKPVNEQFEIKVSYLQSLKTPVLLIFDNVNQMNDYTNLQKLSNPNIHILITTRHEQLIDTDSIKIGKLDYQDDLLPLFQRHSQYSNDWIERNETTVQHIITETLQSHTMLVVLVAKLLYATDLTIDTIDAGLTQNCLLPGVDETIRNFKGEGTDSADEASQNQSLYNHILALFSIANLSGDENKVAILRTMSIVPHSGIQRATLQAWMQLESLDDINALVDEGWLTLIPTDDAKRITMHSVISDAIYLQTGPSVENCNAYLSSLADTMYIEVTEVSVSKAYLIEYGEYALGRIDETDALTGQIAHQLGYLLHSIADYLRALEWYQKALAIREKVLGEHHSATATTYNNIAGVYDSQGDYPKALEWHQKALAIRETVLGKQHPDTATTYNNIAGVYYSQGDYPKALEWFFMALKISENVLGKQHPVTAATYNNIASVYDSQSDYPKALKWYLKDLAISEKVLGKQHPDTAITYNNIAGVYESQGDYPKALEWYLKDLAISEKVLGKQHPDTATTYNNIAGVYDSQGDYPKALEWYLKALTIRENVLGKQHPATATTYNNIAGVYSSQGDYPKALEWYLKDLTISEKVLGKQHPATATTYNNIALVYAHQGDYPQALEWYQKALRILEDKLGPEHPYTISVRKSIEHLKNR